MIRRSLLAAVLLALLVAAPASAQLRYVGDKGVAPVGAVACHGKPGCELSVPKRVKAKAGPSTIWAKVLAPRRVAAGGRAAVRVMIGAGALASLAGRTTTVKVRAVLRRDGERTVKVLKARLRRAALAGLPSTPTSGPVVPAPPPVNRPLTAVDVGGVQLTWYPRDSWIRYVYSGEGMSFSRGASGTDSPESPCPDYPPPSPESRPYTAAFAPGPSWYDPSSGTALVTGAGSVNFRYKGHGIDLTAADPEIEIAPASSRAVFRVSGSGSTAYPEQRVSLLSLDAAGQPTRSPDGKSFTYSLMRGRLTEDGVNVFAGFYSPPDNNQFGCVSVSFTTP